MKTIICFALMYAISLGLHAQQHAIHYGTTFPLGDFADDNVENRNSAAATPGLAIGYEYLHKRDSIGVATFFKPTFYWNAIQKDAKDEMKEGFGLRNDEIRFPNYFTLAFIGGFDFSPNETWRLSVGGVASISKPSKMIVQEDQLKFWITHAYGVCTAISVPITDRIRLSIAYEWLGNHKVKGDVDGFHFSSGKLKQHMFTVMLNSILSKE